MKLFCCRCKDTIKVYPISLFRGSIYCEECLKQIQENLRYEIDKERENKNPDWLYIGECLKNIRSIKQ